MELVVIAVRVGCFIFRYDGLGGTDDCYNCWVVSNEVFANRGNNFGRVNWVNVKLQILVFVLSKLSLLLPFSSLEGR